MIDITLEDIAASHENIGTSLFSNSNGLIVNTAIHFNIKIQLIDFAQNDQFTNLIHGFWQKGLTAKAWINCHHKDLVNQI